MSARRALEAARGAGAGRILPVAFCALLLVAAGGARAAFQPEAQFRDALSRFRNLTESPTARRRPELWDQAAERFRAILLEDRAGAWADDSAYMIAEVSYERFHTFHRRDDLDRALAGYQNLLLRYPQSPYGDDALVQLGEIHYYQLGDVKGALAYYRRAAREYPAGDMAPRARARATAIETANPAPRPTVGSPEATVGERPLPGRPLSSPGAVIGGRVGRVPRRYIEEPPAHEATAPPPRGEVEEDVEVTVPSPDEAPPVRREVSPPAPVTRLPVPEPPRAIEPPVVAPVPEPAPPMRPRNPLLEEGPIPLKTPSDDLPILGPRSRRATPDPRVARAERVP